jgi:hypothetical protein
MEMHGSFLGPSYTNEEIEQFLLSKQALYQRVSDEVLFDRVAQELGSKAEWNSGPERSALAVSLGMRAIPRCNR